VGNAVTCFIYADEGLVGEYDASGGFEKSYGWYPDGLWGTYPVYIVEGGNFYFIHFDHLGTPQRLTDAVGQIVWGTEYAVFGEAQFAPLLTVRNNLRLPGQYFDEETGLNYNWNRYYEPAVGNYTQVDPIGFTGGDLNLYKYAQNNPENYFDNNGLNKQISIGITGSALIGGLLGTGPGVNGSVNIGASFGSGICDLQLFGQVAGAGMMGMGVYAGVGGQVSVSSTDGPLPTLSTSYSGHGEVNAGWGWSAGGAIDVPVESDSGSGEIDFGSPSVSAGGGRFGFGAGFMAGAGASTQTTYAFPPIGEWPWLGDLCDKCE
jgi:RHS repeat-associated protein